MTTEPENTHLAPQGATDLFGLEAPRIHNFRLEPPRIMQASGYPWSHEIRVALPLSYFRTSKSYPVLWVMDNALESALSVLEHAELILVAVGMPRDNPSADFSPRRCYDFYPLGDMYPGGSAGKHLRGNELSPNLKGGGAARFLDFLIDDVRPALAAVYRMDPQDHGLIGFSAGGAFVGFSIFARPAEFAKYICGSPALWTGDNHVFHMEEQYASTHTDLPVHVFFGCGEGEVLEPLANEHMRMGAFGFVSSMARMAETLDYRKYPSLQLSVRIFPGETHATAYPAILRAGVQALWGTAPK